MSLARISHSKEEISNAASICSRFFEKYEQTACSAEFQRTSELEPRVIQVDSADLKLFCDAIISIEEEFNLCSKDFTRDFEYVEHRLDLVTISATEDRISSASNVCHQFFAKYPRETGCSVISRVENNLEMQPKELNIVDLRKNCDHLLSIKPENRGETLFNPDEQN
jgi:hypothetical protein